MSSAPKINPPVRRKLVAIILTLMLGIVLPGSNFFKDLMPVAFAAPLVANTTSAIFINEIHYDNVGTDTGEFVEVAGPAGTNLTGWSIYLYNGEGTRVSYDNDPLPSPIPSQQGGYGTVSILYASNGIQNGSPDGIALVNNLGQVVQFLCYEGTFTAVGGPANGMTCTSIGVTENGSNAVGTSLQLQGTGTTYGNFTWNATPISNTRNSPNTGQIFTGDGTSTLSINNASVTEGNAATASLTFTVSLSSPAGVGGVTFDWNTADGTAQDDNPATDDNDYVQVTGGSGSIMQGSSSTTITVQANGDTSGEGNETFLVNLTNIVGATAGDVQGQGTIVNDDISTIPAIQGSAMASAMAGQAGVITTGIVTGRRSLGGGNNGFYIQDPNGDGNLNTSDAILVFTGGTVPTVMVGDAVQVTGTVTEFESSDTDVPDGIAPPDPKTATEITNPTIVPFSDTPSGNPLPAALSSTALNIFDPAAASRGAELEKYEHMRISVDSLTVSEPTNNFGEFWGVEPPSPRPFREPGIERGNPVPPADQGPHAGSPPPAVPVWDGNFERIMVDTGAALVATGNTRRTQVQVTTGTIVTNIVGPLDFARNQYRIVLDFNVTPGTSGGVTDATPVPVRTNTEFTVAHINLEFFTASNATKMDKATLAIRNVLRTPDILGLIEIDSLSSAQQLATKINNAAADPANVDYVAYISETSTNQDIGYLVNTARVTVVGTPVQYHATDTFNYCGVNNLLHDRPSFILTATVPQPGGGTLPVTVIINHTKSLIGVDSPSPYGTCGTGTEGARNREKRRLQAEDIADLIELRQHENLVVLGDLNAFEFNDGLGDVVNTLQGTPPLASQVVESSTDRWSFQLTNLLTKLAPDQRYSYSFEGSAQTLDHVLVNAQMLARNTRFAYARNNADFSYSFAGDATRPERVSDHDAPVAYFSMLADTDGDGLPDDLDNCPGVSNPDQLDTDGDGAGNACDADDDNDGQSDADEIACGSDPLDAGSKSIDTDSDGSPDCVDTDDDGDGVPDTEDAFPLDPTESVDTDGDGIGNNADTDDDNDGQSDADELACGSDPLDAGSKSLDTDNDGSPDCVDTDDDGDGVPDGQDAFPLDPNESVDTDGDGIGNNADTDDDGDGQTDADEIACGSDPLSAASEATDTDSDGRPDCVDPDDDNDGVLDGADNCRLIHNPLQEDFDQDGIGDACDSLTGPPKNKDQCKDGGWQRFNDPRTFRNQGDCIQFFNTGK